MTSSAFGSTSLSPLRFVSLSRLNITASEPSAIKEEVVKQLGTHKVELDLENQIAIVSG